MGLTPFARVHLTEKYVQAFSFTRPKDATVVVYDLMKDLKFVPDTVTTLDAAILYITGKINALLKSIEFPIQTVVVLVDRKPPPVKRMVTHSKRYKGKNVLRARDGPYLPVQLTHLIPTPWIRFAGNYKNLQREFYPRLLNAFMDNIHLTMRPGQTVVFHGFPGYTEWQTTFNKEAYKGGSDERGRVEIVHTWKESSELPIKKQQEQDDPDLYNRIFYIKCHYPDEAHPQGWLERAEWKDAKNSISESDGAMFFYDHYFANENIMFVCNDGDVFAYGLMYGYERIMGNNTFRNKHYVCMPYKKKKDAHQFPDGRVPKYEYVDLNMLYICVKEDPVFKAAEVQCPITTMAFLLIIAGSDFFKDYMKGLGAEKVLWTTFFQSLSLFSHMVQTPSLPPSTRTPRRIVLDEDAFILFTHYCYLQKYGKTARKLAKKDVHDDTLTYEELSVACSKGTKAQKNSEYKLPSQNQIRLWARQIEWNILYYRNAPFGEQHVPDPFETWHGLPYYPYAINAQTGEPEMVSVVSAFSKPVDEVLSRYMYSSREKNKRQPADNVSALEAKERKQSTIRDLQQKKHKK